MKYKIKINNKTTFILGAILGIVSKLLDINDYNTGLGNMFSEISIWILLGVIITLVSKTKKDAMLNVFLFNIGMIFTYYLTAEITNSIYGFAYIKYWFKIALLSPFMALFVFKIKKDNSRLSKLIKILILGVTIYLILRFGGPRYYDFIILFILIYFIYKERRNVL